MKYVIPSTALPRDFYARDTVTVARELLGKTLVRVVNGKVMAGIIVETEAYQSNEAACHAYKGKTERTACLFGPVGYTYVYFIYGVHFCVNLVAHDELVPAGGVLIRAIEPIMGIGQKTDGPGKLTKALSITREQGGIDATVPGALYVGEGVQYDASEIIATPRIGISVEQDRLWRFYVRNNRGRGA